MNNKYPSFLGAQKKDPDYDCTDLESDGYVLKVSCNKNNPDCQQFINDRKKEGLEVKIIELDPSIHEDNENMIDIWVKQ